MVKNSRNQVLFLFLLLWQWNCCHCGNQCSALFSISAKGHRLKDFLISERNSLSAIECAQLCLIKYPLCQSMNYEVKPSLHSQGRCQLNNATKSFKKENLIQDEQFNYLEPVQVDKDVRNQNTEMQNNEPFFAKFTNLGSTGRLGPTTLGDFYTGQDHDNMVSLVNGIQYWTVPYTGTYQITTVGAAGGYDNSGSTNRGRGAYMRADFDLTKGEIVKILVGQHGDVNSAYTSSGGGGGTFVVTSNDVALIVAGGGGGIEGLATRMPNCDAGTSTSGKNNTCYNNDCVGWSGGTNGGGGVEADTGNSGGGGGGFNGDGRSSVEFGGIKGVGGEGGKSFLNGGTGGRSKLYNGAGGFGGGGGAYGHGGGGGGGGGYSGGASGDNNVASCGGGGGSYNSGKNENNVEGYNGAGHGYVEIKRIFV